MEKKSVVLSDNYKLDIIQGIGNDYKDFLNKIDVIQGNGITLSSISEILGIGRKTLYNQLNRSKRKNSRFFKHLALSSVVNRLYEDAPKKNRSKKNRKKRAINHRVVKPETDKEVTYDDSSD